MKKSCAFEAGFQVKTRNLGKSVSICLLLAAFVAPTAYAEEVLVDPGTVGGEAQNFIFESNRGSIVDLLWSDNKTLEWTAGSHVFVLAGTPCAAYVGILLDEVGEEIPDTELAGRGQCASGSDKIPIGAINLPEMTVFSGIRLSSGAFGDGAGWQWNWNSDDRPMVGETQASGSQPPIANAGGDVTGQVDVPVAFDGRDSQDPDGTIDRYDWDFADTTTGTGATTSHTYAEPGTYNVILTVTDDDGLTNTDNVTATIGEISTPPTADADGPYTGTEGVKVFFDGRDSSDPDGNPLQYDWDFGDDTIALNAGATPTHTYASSGEYPVALTVTDSDGETDLATTTATIAIANQQPFADAGQPVVGTIGRAVDFDGRLSVDPGGTIVQYDWYFGDGTIALAAGPMPTYTYQEAGLYTVNLVVTDDGGLPASDSTTALIGEFSQPPTADANGPYDGQVDAAVSFDGSPSSDPDGIIDRYDWYFGDGFVALDAGPRQRHIYQEPGKYIVELTVTDDSGETDTDVTVATVGIGNLPPQADAGDLVSGEARSRVTFDGTRSSDPDGTIDRYDWYFGDGFVALDAGPRQRHTYQEPGTYRVTLTVTDSDGVTNSDDTLAVIGEDNQSPNCSPAVPSIDIIWPPDRRFVPVEIRRVIDPDGDPVSITIDSIFQDEWVLFRPDGRGVGTDTARVRAQRFPGRFRGNGRVYHIGFTADDGLGGSCSGEVLVAVPLTPNREAVDGGANFDSTVPWFSQ